jgi:dipeptidyl aminopeptidase/acylaminoacyl peptidase
MHDTLKAMNSLRWLKIVGESARLFAVTALIFLIGAPGVQAQDSPQQRRGGFGQPDRGVYKARIAPHWFTNNTQFWYRNDLRDGAKEFILVDAEKGTRQRAFDHDKVAAALAKAGGEDVKPDKLPFSDIEFIDNGNAIKFESSGKSWRCDLNTYQCVALATNSSAQLILPENPDVTSQTSFFAGPLSPQEQTNQPPRAAGQRRRAAGRDLRSPDGKWTAFVRDHNVFIRSDDGKETQLSDDGAESNSYARVEWSPDSRSIVAWRVEPGDAGLVYLIQSSPPGGGRAVMRQRPYGQAGDKFPKYELNIFDVATHKQTKPAIDRYEHEYETPQLHWMRDQRHFAWQQEDRGHQRLRVIEASCDDGATRNLVDEKTKTFIWTAHTENLGLPLVNWLADDEMIYVSEMDGWRHLYLVDPKEGKIKNQITKGEWVVRGIEKVDEDTRQIWFRAGGMNAGQDPYFIHYYRINFDGTGLVALTEDNGNHTVQFSPDRKFLIDTYSRVDMPPAHELRRTSDGKLVCKLEEADISELKETGWEAPEVFVAKGRDGKTDIWGIIHRPKNLDPSKKYPILESIYNGPQGAYVPKSFSAGNRSSAMTDAGFILVQSDAMGTAFRSKAFHDVCWHNLADAGFPDRIAWIKAAAAKYPYMDVSRVGIFGTSAGGQNAAAAVLFHPEFYKWGVANSGCHDNRLDKASWNEQWMGYMPPDKIWSKDPDNWYSQCSNIDNAAKLRGKLFLIAGEMDDNVPPESTMRFVDALIKAKKDFDLLVVPGANHGAASPVTQRRTLDFFVHNLLGKEPPDRNTEEAAN